MSSWSGADSRRERARHAGVVAAGGAVCCRCRRPIVPGQAWQADHWPVSRELGGVETQPAHARCNMSAGGRRGAQITNSRRPTHPSSTPTRSKNIRGI